MISIKDKVVLVTGADGGIGTATCRMLAKVGARLILGSLNEDGLKSLDEELKSYGAECNYKVLDCVEEKSVKQFIDFAISEFGTPEILLNLAGISIAGQIETMETEDFDKIIDVNIKGTFLPSKHFISKVDPENNNIILNIASMASKNENPNAPIYCTAKAGVAMLSKAMALQTKQKNIKVVTLNPGGTSTGFWGDRKVTHEKLMKADDVAECIVFAITRNPGVMISDLSFESFDLYKSK